ncbi:hypothetical protein GF406_23110 [candidate division KSB1 bacterium]|nr:hypothetical protein [candidate division KSB1 bacterium]
MIIVSGMACQSASDEKIFNERIFIDHQNLRYVEDPETIAFQVRSAKGNIEQATEYGIDTYLFFAKETFEAMLNYDFNVEGIGHIGQKSFPRGGTHRQTAEYLRAAFREVIDFAQQRNIRVFFHSNQFIFPDQVLKTIKPVVWGTAVCPGRQPTWEIYRKKLDEFLRLFPGIAGFQVTGDETQVSVLECDCDSCSHMSFVDRVNLLTQMTAEVCEEHGKQVQMRTWQRMSELEEEKHPSQMGEGLPENVFFSIKNTEGDFHLIHAADETFLHAVDPHRVIVEFDAWREYNGNNYFPCFMGAIWAPRFRLLKDLGIKRIAVRLNWNSNKNPIFAMPWGNNINIFAFLKLSQDPLRSAEDILTEFVEHTFPATARQAAIDLYSFSPEFQETIYYIKSRYNANHSRVQDDDAVDDLRYLQQSGLFIHSDDFDKRRQKITSVCEKAHRLVGQLGEEVPQEWIDALKIGIRVEQFVALGTTDKMEAIYWQQKNNALQFERIVQKLKQHQKEWQVFHPESYDSMNGEDLLKDIQ